MFTDVSVVGKLLQKYTPQHPRRLSSALMSVPSAEVREKRAVKGPQRVEVTGFVVLP
jgi:hypothetical protein